MDLSNYWISYDTTSTGVFVEIETILHGRGARDVTFAQMNPVAVSLQDGILQIRPPETIFREKIPLTFVEYHVIVHAPKHVLIRSPWGDAYNSRRTHLEDFTLGRRECALSRYIYDVEREAFYCDPTGYSPEILDQAMRDYSEKFSWSGFREEQRVYTGSIVASGSYIIDTYDDQSGENHPSLVQIFINAKGDIWGARGGSRALQP